MNCRFVLASIRRIQKYHNNPCISRNLTTEKNGETKDNESKLSGFAKAFEKHTNIDALMNTTNKEPSFATLLRNSKFIDVSFIPFFLSFFK